MIIKSNRMCNLNITEKNKIAMDGPSNQRSNNDAEKAPEAETFKAQTTAAASNQVNGGDLLGLGSDSGSVGSSKKFYRAAEKR